MLDREDLTAWETTSSHPQHVASHSNRVNFQMLFHVDMSNLAQVVE